MLISGLKGLIRIFNTNGFSLNANFMELLQAKETLVDDKTSYKL